MVQVCCSIVPQNCRSEIIDLSSKSELHGSVYLQSELITSNSGVTAQNVNSYILLGLLSSFFFLSLKSALSTVISSPKKLIQMDELRPIFIVVCLYEKTCRLRWRGRHDHGKFNLCMTVIINFLNNFNKKL